jgi:hypothetical protein
MTDGLDSNELSPIEQAELERDAFREENRRLHAANAELVAERRRLIEQIEQLGDIARGIVHKYVPHTDWSAKFRDAALVGPEKKARKGVKQ